MLKNYLANLIKKQQDLDEEVLIHFNVYWKPHMEGCQHVSIFKEIVQHLKNECGNVDLPEEIEKQLRIMKHDVRLAEMKRHQNRVWNARECLPTEIETDDDGWLSVR